MKKLFSIFLTLVLMVSFTATNAMAAGSPANDSIHKLQNNQAIREEVLKNQKVETLEDTKDHQKIKYTNLKTNEVEYLESSLENGKYVYYSTSKQGRIRIENISGTIKLTNEDTKEVKLIQPNKTNDPAPNSKQSIMELGSDWQAYNYQYGSYPMASTVVTIVAGALASVYGGPVEQAIVTIATVIIAFSTPDWSYSMTQFFQLSDINYKCDEIYYYAGYFDNYAGMYHHYWRSF